MKSLLKKSTRDIGLYSEANKEDKRRGNRNCLYISSAATIMPVSRGAWVNNEKQTRREKKSFPGSIYGWTQPIKLLAPLD